MSGEALGPRGEQYHCAGHLQYLYQYIPLCSKRCGSSEFDDACVFRHLIPNAVSCFLMCSSV